MPRVAILCLGDIGRSPRMQYHAHAVTQQTVAEGAQPWSVELIGYRGTSCFPHLLSNPHIRLHLFEPPAFSLASLPGGKLIKLALAPVKVLLQVMTLLRILLFKLSESPDYLLVQNPPSIPTLLVSLLACWWHSAMLIVDWHNFGWSLLGLNFGADSLIVRVATEYERVVGSAADGHLCVTREMQGWLRKEWGIRARVLHDRAQEHFHKLSAKETHELFKNLVREQKLLPGLESEEWMSGDEQRFSAFTAEQLSLYHRGLTSSDSTLFTFLDSSTGEVCHRVDRPTLIVSSTSWTADEDFTILARAIEQYDQCIAESREGGQGEGEEEEGEGGEKTDGKPVKRGAKKSRKIARTTSSSSSGSSDSRPKRPLPRAVFLITGKGPLRSAFDESIRALSLRYTKVYTLFVASSDYPLLLGAADLGVSLHYSSSGMDLPMKVVDMFGAGLPVCAVHFKCIGELVQDGVNGRIFGKPPQEIAASTTAADSSPAGKTDESGNAESSSASKHSSDSGEANTNEEASSNAEESKSEREAERINNNTSSDSSTTEDSSSPASSSSISASSSSPVASIPSPSPVDSAPELAFQFAELFSDFPAEDSSDSQLVRLRRGAEKWAGVTWQECWQQSCAPLLTPRKLEEARADRKRVQWRALSILLMAVGVLLMIS